MQNIVSLFNNLLHAFFLCCPGALFRRASNLFLMLSAGLFLALFSTASATPVARDLFGIPLEYGQVIYRVNENSPKQLYIVGISHRDPETRQNGSYTIETQTDIFRIGEWLRRHREMQLLLPEGYFTPATACPVGPAEQPLGQLDNDLLRRKLADESRFVNAEMLLLENCRMRVSQIEDRNIYNAVYNTLRNLNNVGDALQTPEERLTQLQYLQEIRTAVLLQKIPSIIDSEFNTGRIDNQSAMFTIGLNHIQDIVRYFQNNEIRINAPASENSQAVTFSADLNLLKTGYGVTVILPRTLAQDQRLLQMTNLDRILLARSDR